MFFTVAQHSPKKFLGHFEHFPVRKVSFVIFDHLKMCRYENALANTIIQKYDHPFLPLLYISTLFFEYEICVDCLCVILRKACIAPILSSSALYFSEETFGYLLFPLFDVNKTTNVYT